MPHSTWTIPLDRAYPRQTLLVCGLSGTGDAERYLFLDLATGTVREERVDIAAARSTHRDWLSQAFAGHPLPYGLDHVDQLLPYFLHPHSFVQTSDGRIAVSFKQAPYLRILDPAGGAPAQWPAESDVDLDHMLGSTACEVAPNTLAYGVTSAGDRLQRYVTGTTELRACVRHLDVTTGHAETVVDLPPFLLDTLHEVEVSPAGYMVAVDMNLTVESGPTGEIDGTSSDGLLDPVAYAANPFPAGRFVVVGEGGASVHSTSASCSAHVNIDLDDPAVFYVSCNNISKWRSDVVVHGPGVVERYRYVSGRVVPEGTFSRPDFQRITSQELFHRDGRQLMAVTGYPNKLFILDPETMELDRCIELFDAREEPVPYACAKNSAAPLYLAVDPSGRYVFMTGASSLFVVDLDESRVVDRAEFCSPGSLMATAHIGLVS